MQVKKNKNTAWKGIGLKINPFWSAPKLDGSVITAILFRYIVLLKLRTVLELVGWSWHILKFITGFKGSTKIIGA